ncbi:DNA mismatch repair protein MutL [Metschnikowia aff. pulcherrima]|uniref:DNA mismatch repair protein MutL n=1 Tax=Metschnikowia aff. pulcherrima TaxID=2163413 RepID=A0A4P6XMX0_9ASCO|nr:DNA mismatch repair protein MutL [Metschnikowia aff. pulcherrima]
MAILSISETDVSKITSGQVIVDLTSVVKELVDNAIDAGCDKIEITFHNQGAQSIEVADNGGGIDISDFETLCLKHHTSKLTNYEDLASVATLGFRGEAMSSLCAVAKVKVHTCSASTFPRGTQLEYDSMGKILAKKSVVSGKKGTSVTVTDLFHGMPVRQKNFVKHIKKEYSKSLALLHGYLLAYTNIRFTIYNVSGTTGKKTMVMGTQGGKSTIGDVMTTIYGSNGLHGLIPVDISVNDIEARFKLNMSSVPVGLSVNLTGYISDCSFGMGRAASDRQYFSINKRPVTHKKITKIVNEVYKSFNTTQSPVFVLDLKLDSYIIDINVTPDKRLIMMQCEELICEVLREEIIALYQGRNNIIPKSQVGVVDMGSQKMGSQQKRLDHIRSSQVSFDQATVISEESNSKPPSGSLTMLRDIHEKQGASINSEDLEVTEIFLDDAISNERKRSQTPLNDDHEEIILNSKLLGSTQIEPFDDAEDALAQTSDDGESDNFEDIDVDELTFSSPLKKHEAYTDVDGRSAEETDDKNTLGLFVCDNDDDNREIPITDTIDLSSTARDSLAEEMSRSSEMNESPGGIHLENVSQNLVDDSGDDGYFSTKSQSDEDEENQTDMQNDEVSTKHHSCCSVDNSELLPTNPPKKRSSDHLQGVQRKLRLKIEDSHAYVACEAESPKPASSLASLQDITEAMEICKNDFTKMLLVGQFNSGFIIVTHEGKLFIVDQHALDEIYNYEKLMKNLTLRAQPLVVPQVLELSPIDEMKILECAEHLGKNGFVIEELDDAVPGRRIRLVGIPVLKNVVFDVSDLHELVHKLHEQGAGVGPRSAENKHGSGRTMRSALSSCRCTKVDRMIALRACRLSIMIGLALSKQTMSRVVKNLATLDRPWNCPHGRPTMRHLADIQGTGFSDDYEL